MTNRYQLRCVRIEDYTINETYVVVEDHYDYGSMTNMFGQETGSSRDIQYNGQPFKVKQIAAPFLLIEWADGRPGTIDIRKMICTQVSKAYYKKYIDMSKPVYNNAQVGPFISLKADIKDHEFITGPASCVKCNGLVVTRLMANKESIRICKQCGFRPDIDK